MQESNNGQDDEVTLRRQEMALREREIERHRRSSSIRREELKTKRLVAFLSLVGLVVAGGVVFLVVDLIMKKSTDRAIAIERERMLDRRELAEHQAELDKAVALARAEAEGLQGFAAAAAGHDLVARLEMASLQAEIATQDETRERWEKIRSYLEQQLAERREAFREVEQQITENRQRYTATVNEIISSRAPSAEREERLAKLDAELAALRVKARRMMMDLGGTPPVEAGHKDSALLPTHESRSTGNAKFANADGTLVPIPHPRPAPALAALQAPTPLAPPDGSTFNHFPRQTVMSWSPVPGAATYTVEVDCFECCGEDSWCSDLGKEYLTVPGVVITRHGVNFGNNRQGRWRVWATTADGIAGAKSAWSEFAYVE